MSTISMQEELEILRQEVETLRKLKATQEEDRLALEITKQEEEKELLAKTKEKTDEIISSLEEGKTDAKEALEELVDTLKKDYENISPTTTIVLFALGTLFGHLLSKK